MIFMKKLRRVGDNKLQRNKLTPLLIKSSRKYYEMGIKIFIGNMVVQRLETLQKKSSWNDLKKLLLAETSKGLERWLDISGLLASESLVREFCKRN